jgi:hypothetical protein
VKRIFPRGTQADDIIRAVATMVAAIDISKSWCITVEPWKRKRSDAQNRFLWGVAYPMILEQGGETLGGWTRDDLHEYFLGECFGWEMLEGFGRKRMRPLKRSSALTKEEFTEYLMFLEQRCIDMGMGPLPEPVYE